ncbi:TrmB family transcriptional regulator [Haloferax mediterranei ATCC 33500]|uniref:Transcription regulator n=1 Tax=Haloferax mediterranei (strain ATCC 33500 / DSM 1411 / JCM 8866 / NBRC 14739 / NCIMB 2177 / R-4) TaxID=523841 RepID=I3R735_HALMT|nr:TrmB family transcriptional regulator [Haloferax mediterranei]AFK20045.1 transcription regulator [Haloferax mediterranei ATCC 33500]AHZ23423.1 transcriptional regulator [Haloferax mediterranei ATCC 33500]ELZ99593.1 transcriptional regulator [Haloferax mediterranei ATCC 33500]MDX5987203.1 TrmB family transcriptional regulator [Haloferax mediterranei ATCC 33500]QCQ76508.1 TrmB family transcriptional regulator [Haloferax mediterranei ATCC 33500]
MTSLRDLGLSEYEARAYRALLRTGATTAKELSRASDVPMGRIYDVLNSLEQYHLIRSQAASRPKKYVAVEPDTALDRLLESKHQELEEKAEQYENVVAELTDELDAAEPVHDQFWTAAVGADETMDLLVERLAAADDTLIMVAGTPSPQFDLGTLGDLVVEELEAALERGVEISLLMSPDLVDSLPESVGRRYMNRLSKLPNFHVRTAENLTGVFNLIDDVEVCIEVHNPLNPGQAFAMIDLKDPDFAADLRSTFDPRWEEATPLPL